MCSRVAECRYHHLGPHHIPLYYTKSIAPLKLIVCDNLIQYTLETARDCCTLELFAFLPTTQQHQSLVMVMGNSAASGSLCLRAAIEVATAKREWSARAIPSKRLAPKIRFTFKATVESTLRSFRFLFVSNFSHLPMLETRNWVWPSLTKLYLALNCATTQFASGCGCIFMADTRMEWAAHHHFRQMACGVRICTRMFWAVRQWTLFRKCAKDWNENLGTHSPKTCKMLSRGVISLKGSRTLTITNWWRCLIKALSAIKLICSPGVSFNLMKCTSMGNRVSFDSNATCCSHTGHRTGRERNSSCGKFDGEWTKFLGRTTPIEG